MSRSAVVVENRGDTALLLASRRGACDSCSHKGECTFDNALGKDKPEKVLAKNPIHARPGDLVEFDLPGHGELKVSILIWLVPLLGLVGGAVLGSIYGSSLGEDLSVFIGAMAGLAVTFTPVIIFDRLRGRSHDYTYVILRRADSACSSEEHPS